MGLVSWDKRPITAVINGVEDKNSLLRKHDKLIRGLARQFDDHKDDAAQIGRLAFLRVLERWQENGEKNTAQLWSYARHRVYWAMFDFVKSDRTREWILEFDTQEEVRTERWNVFSSEPAPDDFCEAREHVRRLTSEESEVLSRHLSGEDYRSIAKDLHISKSVVHRTLTAAVNELRQSA